MFRKLVAVLALSAFTTLFGMSLGTFNSADKETLMQIKGIGEKKAALILKERKKGKFKSFDDLMARVSGIGEQIVSNIKNDVKSGEKGKKTSSKPKSKKPKSGKTEHKKETAKKPTDKKPTDKKPKSKKKTKPKSKSKEKPKKKKKPKTKS